MTQRHAFLDAILANPADDTPRLVFADWLEEHGEAERAEFIRVQCELEPMRTHGHGASNPHGGDCPECLRVARLERRERELLDRGGNRLRWSPFSAGHPGDDVSVTYRRGFVAEIILPCEDWLRHRESLQATAPLERVMLTQVGAGEMWQENGVLVCEVFPWQGVLSDMTFGLIVRAGKLWTTTETGRHDDCFEVRVDVRDLTVLDFAATDIDMAFRIYWNRMRVDRANDQRILHGNPDAPAPQGIIHTARRPR